MNTPIYDFVQNYIRSNTSRLHMPGHKGVSFLGCEQSDITEIRGADELYAPTGIIRESEGNASQLFSTSKTVYSVGGSSQSINAMLYLAYLRADKSQRPFVLAGRNAHKSFTYAVAKLDCDVEWLYPENSDSICSCIVTAEKLEARLNIMKYKPFAVYITSPDYLGGMSDIKSIAEVCKKHHIPLLVDNAHGSYLKFCKEDMHPISLGADMCCDSAHKTLPVLTGGGYLHISRDDKYNFSENAVNAMAIFGSTSPSYLILQSLDLCNRYIDKRIRDDIFVCTEKINEIRKIMAEKDIPDVSDEPLKITADFRGIDLDFQCILSENSVEYEYADGDFFVFMLSPQNCDEDYLRLKNAFMSIKNVNNNEINSIEIPVAEGIMTIRQAVFSQCEEIPVGDSAGRICASPMVSCPPAIPLVVSGERITEKQIDLFKKYKIRKILVIK